MTQTEFTRYVRYLQKEPPEPTHLLLESIHALLGIGGESGELLDLIKKHWVYGSPLDRVHLIEELGDLFHYFTMFISGYGISLDEIRDANVRKLQVRYPNGYTQTDAKRRNPIAEREALEGE